MLAGQSNINAAMAASAWMQALFARRNGLDMSAMMRDNPATSRESGCFGCDALSKPDPENLSRVLKNEDRTTAQSSNSAPCIKTGFFP
jgi:hypothetical protein